MSFYLICQPKTELEKTRYRRHEREHMIEFGERLAAARAADAALTAWREVLERCSERLAHMSAANREALQAALGAEIAYARDRREQAFKHLSTMGSPFCGLYDAASELHRDE